MNLEHTSESLDELEDEFTSRDFSAIKEVGDQIQELRELNKLDIDDWSKWIGSHYETFQENKKQGFVWQDAFGYNGIQTHFVFYNLYRLISNNEKALLHAELAHQYYIRNTLCYQWENVVYKAFREIYGHSVVPDCVLPNNKRPDLVINPTHHEFKYHPKGTRIVKAEKIIDMKTSIYDTTKENKFYKDFCDELIIVYIGDGKGRRDESITFISSEELLDMVSDRGIIERIKIIQRKMKIDYLIKEFDSRITDVTSVSVYGDPFK